MFNFCKNLTGKKKVEAPPEEEEEKPQWSAITTDGSDVLCMKHGKTG